MKRRDKQRVTEKQCPVVEEKSVTNSSKDLYNAVKTITRKFKPKIDAVKSENGVLLTEGPQVKERSKEYCESLYKQSNIQRLNQQGRRDQEEEEAQPTYFEIKRPSQT